MSMICIHINYVHIPAATPYISRLKALMGGEEHRRENVQARVDSWLARRFMTSLKISEDFDCLGFHRMETHGECFRIRNTENNVLGSFKPLQLQPHNCIILTVPMWQSDLFLQRALTKLKSAKYDVSVYVEREGEGERGDLTSQAQPRGLCLWLTGAGGAFSAASSAASCWRTLSCAE